ncbi:hypothetical protein PA598K_07101 [Paenibacillus sp. 598K]|nr:hypothetical protein PA598K_07101 [Paenibacillus sp. 598K]
MQPNFRAELFGEWLHVLPQPFYKRSVDEQQAAMESIVATIKNYDCRINYNVVQFSISHGEGG